VSSVKPSTLKDFPFQVVMIQYRRKLKLSTFIEGYKERFNRRISEDNEAPLSLHDCFHNFSHKEVLERENTVYCNKCKKHQEATKQMELYKTNKIMVLAFKRFNRHRKISTSIDFPIDGLDIGPYLLCTYYLTQRTKTSNR
jgi:ubiquitin carboxyl-terminal hydrolase 4/11